MAAVGDCFAIGSTVACKTCFNMDVEGEVLAFDQGSKMLVLKCSATSKTLQYNDVFTVNLEYCSNVTVKKEVGMIPEAPQSLNLQRLTSRMRNHIDHKKRWVSALRAGVSPEGQKLYMAIAKTINQQVTWKGPNIVVFNDVTISPPYKVENVMGNRESREFVYVTKIVDKFVSDQQAAVMNISQSSNNCGGDMDGGRESAQSVSPVSSLSSNTTTSAAGSTGNNTTAPTSGTTAASGGVQQVGGPGQVGASGAGAAAPSPVSAN